MKLNLRQIEVFRAVMLTGSISGAAALLHVSQPAVSRLMSYTESRLRLVLFERIKGRLFPTPEARELFAEVQGVYQGVQRVNELAADLVDKRAGTLRLAVSPSLGQTLIPAAVARFRKRNPEVRINIQTLISTQLIQALVTQQAEIGVAVIPVDHPNLMVAQIYEDRLVAVLPKAHPLASRAKLRPRDLKDADLIGYGPDTPVGQRIEQMFRADKCEVHLRIEVRLTHLACAMAQAGNGVAIVDELAVMGRVWPDVVVRPITPATALPVNVVQSRFEPLSLVAKDFVAALTELNFDDLRQVSGKP